MTRALTAPAQSVDAERALLGALLVSPEVIPSVRGVIEPAAFYDRDNRLVFEGVVALHESDRPIDVLTLTEQLRAMVVPYGKGGLRGEESALDIVGQYNLSGYTTEACYAGHVQHYALFLREKQILRDIREHAMALVAATMEPSADAFDVLQQCRTGAETIAAGIPTSGVHWVAETVGRTLADLELRQREAAEGGVPGLRTGIPHLDYKIGGLRPGRLHIVAGRPGMGKSGFAKTVALNAAEQGATVLIVSLEMGAGEINERILSELGEVDGTHIQNGQIADEDWPRLARAAGLAAKRHIAVVDTPDLSPTRLAGVLHRLDQQHGVDLVIVDYLQLMEGDEKTQGRRNREQEIAAISRGMKVLAKRYDVPFIVLAQLSRAVETRGGDRRPILSDLRESGAIEQDADVVGFLWRPEYYGITEATIAGRLRKTGGLCEINVAKCRGGQSGPVWMEFDGPTTSFRPWYAPLSPMDEPDGFGRQDFDREAEAERRGGKGEFAPSAPPPDDYTEPTEREDAPF